MQCYPLIFTGILCGVLHTGLTTNQAPVFTSPTSPITVVENEDGQLSLYTLTVSDPDGDVVTCSLLATNPYIVDFGVLHNSTDYEVYLLAGSTLDFTVNPVYRLTVECSDGSTSSSMNVTVNVTPNSPPTFSNLPATSSSKNANSVGLGDVVYTVTATDTDSTSLTYSLTSFPVSPDLFEIDTVSGKVKASQDLIYAVNSAYELTITVSDSRATTSNTLIIPIINFNTAPIINNLPNTVYIKETVNSNTGLFDLSISDPDGGDTVTITYVVSPILYTSKFSFNGQQVRLASGTKFDYEEQSTFTLTFSVSDGKVTTSNANYVLTVNIVDVNEACAFEYSTYFVTMQEANVGGSLVDPGFTVTDDDTGSTFTFYPQDNTNASLFTIDQNSGLISFAVNYDVDATHPSDPSFRVYCIDNYGSTSHTTLYVTVEDANDNVPHFNVTGYILYFDQTMVVPHSVGSISATDADSGNNAAIDYAWSTTGTGSTYFSLVPSGVIVLQKDPGTDLSYGDSFRFVVTATDRGLPALTGTTTVDIIYREVTSPTTVTTSATTTTTVGNQPSSSDDNSFWDEPGNIAVVVVGSVLGIVLCGLVAYLIWKYRGKIGLFKTKPKKMRPKPKPEKIPFDFWSTDKSKNVPTAVSKKPGAMGAATKGSTAVFTL